MKMVFQQAMGNCTPEEMLDKERIRELIEFERYCRDYGHWPEERSCWWEDGSVYATWFKGPIDEFLEKSARKDKKSGYHRINNTVVWLNGNKAIAECLCVLVFRSDFGGEPVDIDVFSRLHFRVEKRDGKWGLLYFEGIYEKDRLNTVFDDGDFTIPREELQKFRPCNWHQTYRLAKYNADAFGGGLKNNDDWCGSDKPETIERLYKESSEWFYN